MNRKYLKEQAKNILKTNYAEVLKWIVIAYLLSLSFVSTDVTTDYYGTQLITLSIFNLQFNLEPSAIFNLLIPVGILLVIYNILVLPIITYGLANKIKSFTTNKEFDFFSGFKANYMKIFILNLMVSIRTFLWALLLIIPGIIAGYKYRYVNEIYEEHQDWDYNQVIKESINITNGHKMELFILDLSFFLWHLLFGILDLFTLGLGSLLLEPYIKLTNIYAYHDLKKEHVTTDQDSFTVGNFAIFDEKTVREELQKQLEDK